MILRRLKNWWLRVKYVPIESTFDKIDSLQPLADKDGYDNAQEWLSDTSWELQAQLAEKGIYDVTKQELFLLLLDENGDKEKVMQGYLED